MLVDVGEKTLLIGPIFKFRWPSLFSKDFRMANGMSEFSYNTMF